MNPRIGELFAGYGGLGMGVQAVIGGEIAWFSEFDAAPSKILAHHFPGVPNHGDITKIDWSTVEPVDVLTGGFPCQDVSLAGARKGLKEGTRSGLWSEFAKAIDALRPGLVVIENVRGLLSAKTIEEISEDLSDMESQPGGMGELGRGNRPVLNAFGRVLGDLAVLGYDAEWVGLRAADAGATHNRYRVFIVAHPKGEPWGIGNGNDVRPRRGAVERGADAGRGSAQNADLAAGDQRWQPAPGQAESWRARADTGGRGGTPAAADASRIGLEAGRLPRRPAQEQPDPASRVGSFPWGIYEPAIRRWERVTRPAPDATQPNGRGGKQRLDPAFVEWMMGLPAGHVAGPDVGLTRNDQLKALGNGVVPQQAALAIRHLLNRKDAQP